MQYGGAVTSKTRRLAVVERFREKSNRTLAEAARMRRLQKQRPLKKQLTFRRRFVGA
jgi:hypothetical protein